MTDIHTNRAETKGAKAILLCMLVLFSMFSGCTGSGSADNSNYANTPPAGINPPDGIQLDGSGDSGAESTDYGEYLTSGQLMALITDPMDVLDTIDESETAEIIFEGDAVSAGGLAVNGSVVYITEAGTYTLSGASDEGRVIIDLEERGSVNLILNGLSLSSSEGSPIAIKEATTTIMTLAAGSENSITDLSPFVDDSGSDEDAANSAIYSKDDLYINGRGSLAVYSENRNGIQGKDQLVIIEGNIIVDAAKEAIKGKDYVLVENGTLSLTSREDGISATEDESPEKGFVLINGGTISINSAQDGIQAETYAIINGGNLNILADGGESDSSKGIKAGTYLEINGGEISISSTGDSIHSDNEVIINGGSVTLSSGDDGVHADAKLTINDGSLVVKKSYEGLESKNVILNGGNIRLKSSDDGINIADASSSGFMGGGMAAISDASLTITGGYVYVDANGDGLDSNGDFYMDGGTVIVDGPLMNGNGGIDVNGECRVDGGFLIVAGSIGMAESPDSSSSQNALSIGFSSQLPAGTLVHIESEDGEAIVTHAPSKAFQSFVFSSADLISGKTYDIYIDGTAAGASTDGLYGAVEDKGTLYGSFTVNSATTLVGSAPGMMGMGTGPGGNRPMGR